MDRDAEFMSLALDLARRAGEQSEVPIGAVVVMNDEVVGQGWNGPVGASDPTAHAEIRALRDAGKRTENYRLGGAILYSTVEPCMMCLGAAVHARIARLVYGASDPKVGAVERWVSMTEDGAGFNHGFDAVGGVLAAESMALLRGFFHERRDGSEGNGAAGRPRGKHGEVPKWS